MAKILKKDGSFDQVGCAQARISLCKKWGLEIDPEDEEIIKNGGRK
jgi:hypothetical protein